MGKGKIAFSLFLPPPLPFSRLYERIPPPGVNGREKSVFFVLAV